ncbi:ribosomal L1 domain-containing protein 1-like [Argonauta hians]
MSSPTLDINLDQVNSSVKALFSFLEKKNKNELFDVPVKILMSFTLKKIPKIKTKVINLKNPHGLGFPSQYICLFAPDLDKRVRDSDPTVFHYKELLAEKNITCVSEIITLKTLYLEYRPVEAKRKLCNKFDLFLADRSIFGPLPRILGRDFFRRKRIPVKIDLKSKTLKEDIDSAVNDSYMVITGRGSCCMAHVANSTMTEEQVCENIVAAVNNFCQSLPSGCENIKNIFIKTDNSTAIPIYMALPDNVEIKEPEKKVTEDPEAEEITWKLTSDAYIDEDYNVVLCRNNKKKKLSYGDTDFTNVPKQLQTLRKALVKSKRTKNKEVRKEKARKIWKEAKQKRQSKNKSEPKT